MSNEPMTLQQIADIEGVSKQRVAEILESAMRKMRKALLLKGLKLEDIL
jgi:DNA-directed RNA polymerase sigma subunit (sigma70/sigma32)